MLTQMEVFTKGVPTPPLPIVDQAPALDMIQITDVQGLGPVKATVNTTQYGSVDGEFFNGSFTPKRNIVITAKLNPDWANQTYESLRQILYLYFMPENLVRLRFSSTHMATVEIEGYVESCEPDMFSQDGDYQISIICPQPYFTAIGATVISGVSTALGGAEETVISYEGNVETGFILDLMLPQGGSAFNGEVRLINKTPNNKLTIATPVAVSTTTYFELSSIQGSKYARQYPLPSGVYSNVLGKVTPDSTWLTLRKGDNHIQVMSATAGLLWTLSYYAKYGGL